MLQSQARSGPCWMTRLSALMSMSHPGSRVPSASMMGLAGWLRRAVADRDVRSPARGLATPVRGPR